MLKQVAEAHLCTSLHFVLWEFLCSSCKSILFNVPVQDLKMSCTLSSKGPFFCSLDLQENCRSVLHWLFLCNFPNDLQANYTIIIFLMVCCLLYRCRICHLGLWKGPKGLTDEFYGFIKLRKRSIFVIDSYLKGSAFTAVKRNAKF